MTRVFIIHRWEGHPREGWYPWMKKELGKHGCKVHVLRMPHAGRPTIPSWTSYLKKQVRFLDERTFFVGHSIGCQTILRALKLFPEGSQAGGAVFLAPWITLKGLEAVDDTLIAKPWETLPIDVFLVQKALPRIVAFFSDNDYFVPLKNRVVFEREFGARTIVRKQAKHFTGEDGCTQIPFARDALIKLMGI
jgi:hypothetical protein